MSLRDDLPKIKKHFHDFRTQDLLKHNKILFEIFEGELLKYVLADLQQQLRPESYNSIRHRVAPINVLKKLVDKLSKIYEKPPVRMINNDSPGDKTLYEFYWKHMGPDENFNHANEFYNMFKNTFIEPFVQDGKPMMRSIPSHQFLVFGADEINPMRVTHLVKIMGNFVKLGSQGKGDNLPDRHVQKLFIYTDKEFLIVDSEFEVMQSAMTAANNTHGKNPFGTIPGEYINRSRNKLTPLPDTDTLQMTKLFPILISDMNFAIMFQAFSIIYGIDLDEENLSMSPNAFWRFKTDRKAGGDIKPEIGVIKPELDTDKVIAAIKFQLVFWLESRNIRPGNVGKMTGGDFANGISKMIDEMDTSSERTKQIPVFQKAEASFWKKIANNFHPVWAREGKIDLTTSFSSNVEVNVEFQEQRPNIKRSEIISEQKEEIDAGFTTRKRAIKKLNPGMTEKEVLELMAEVDAERTIEIDDGSNDASHSHTLPGGGSLGAAIDNPDGTHTHTLPDGKNTGASKDEPGHTHTTPDGPTSPAKEVSNG